MNRHEAVEIVNMFRYKRAGVGDGLIARSVSALIRAARTNKSRTALLKAAADLGVIGHPEFII
jgi:hypothetical protein